MDGSLVASADFKSVVLAQTRWEVGSIPTRTRHFFEAGRKLHYIGDIEQFISYIAACQLTSQFIDSSVNHGGI